MPYPQFDRSAVKMQPLAARENKFEIQKKVVLPDREPAPLPSASQAAIVKLVERIVQARDSDRPVMCTFGAHAIKNGLGPVFIKLIEDDWFTHLATNGAGIIHDWEFSYQGKSCEDVQRMVDQGQFGNWEETGFYINLALNVGAYEGKGYGESVGGMIHTQALKIPEEEELEEVVARRVKDDAPQAAAAADLLSVVREFQLKPGRLEIPHEWRRYSAQASAYRLGVPFTGHPMIGHDIIYNHPMNQGAGLGRCAERDFLTFAESVSRIDGGVYISIGSAVMSPMIFEKSLSMSQNLAIQRGEHIDGHYIQVVDLAKSDWDWSQGEPPEDNPAYYLRYNKTFSRMGGTLNYLQADNRDFLLTLTRQLETMK
ncbi:MAG: hypothetical protein KDA57_01845 [Planctomycetales bacterium]|nr:hypothetical protein [Planctomycetales bacterium]